MGNYSLLFPVPPGKSDDAVKGIAKAAHADTKGYRDSRKRAGVTRERVYLQKTPMGNFVVAYVEGTKDAGPTVAAYVSSDLPFDRKFVDLIREIHGIDLRQAPPSGPEPETIAQWWDPDVRTRGRGMAFTAPIVPGKSPIGRAFAAEAFQKRASEFAASRRALGQNGEVITLQATPAGDVINVYLEGADPFAANAKFAASNSPYDRWFKDQCATFFAPFVDFNKPVGGVEEIFNSDALPM